jgi:DNA invertase Pin-like site-specific DNA recombinase
MSTNSPRVVAYLRVSTPQQDVHKNKYEILQLANQQHLTPVEWVEETISGRVTWRKRQIGQLMHELQSGDTLLINELSRLGRSMLECMEILAVATDKGIRILATKGNWRLDNSLQSKVVAMAFAMAAEIERDLISQRTREALAARRQAGQTLGRPKGIGKSKLDVYRLEIEALLANGATQKFVAERYQTSPANLARWIKKHGLVRQR